MATFQENNVKSEMDEDEQSINDDNDIDEVEGNNKNAEEDVDDEDDQDGDEVGSDEEDERDGNENNENADTEDEDGDDDSDNEDNIDDIATSSKPNSQRMPADILNDTQFKYDNDINEDDFEDFTFEKFDNEIRDKYISEYHPEFKHRNLEEVIALTNIKRNEDNLIEDELHKTVPFLTKYEKTKVIGLRIKQLSNGSTPFINVQEIFRTPNFLDNFAIAEKELEMKKIPFIIARPVYGKTVEYWNLKDLELIHT